MKTISIMVSLFVTILGSLFGCQKPSPEVAVLLLEPQGEELKNALAGISYKIDGTKISVGNHTIEVLPYIELCVVNDSNHACGVRFEISERGKKDSTWMYGMVGNGNSKEAALRQAVQGWWSEFAVPLFGYFGGPKPDFGEWPFLFYPGVMSIRGTPPKDWVDGQMEMHKRITPTLRPLVGRKPGIRVLSIRLLIGSDGVQDMGSRINGELSTELVKAVSDLPWPKTTNKYIFYQTYIVRYKDDVVDSSPQVP
jgi:uncharacterized protein DUF6348